MSTDSDNAGHDYHVKRARSKIQRHLSRSLDVTRVEVIDDPELYPSGATPSETDAILLVSVRHPENDEVLGDMSRGDAERAMYAHVDEQLFDVDAFIVESSIPPTQAVNQSCLFYLQAAL